jgi:predicted RNA-binding protein YlqC (UPF0109 family)
MTGMQAFLDYVIKGLVDRPDAVALTSVERNGLTVYELRVHPTDMGKIIGRQGATINAIRALLLVGSAKQGLRCALEVLDEEGGERRERPDRPERRGGGDDRFRGGRAGGRSGGDRRGGFRGGPERPGGHGGREPSEFGGDRPAHGESSRGGESPPSESRENFEREDRGGEEKRSDSF